MGKAADQCRTVQFLELVEFRTVDHAGDDVVDVERLAAVGGDHAVDFLGWKQRLAWFAHAQRSFAGRFSVATICCAILIACAHRLAHNDR